MDRAAVLKEFSLSWLYFFTHYMNWQRLLQDLTVYTICNITSIKVRPLQCLLGLYIVQFHGFLFSWPHINHSKTCNTTFKICSSSFLQQLAMPQHIKINVTRKTLFEDSFQQVRYKQEVKSHVTFVCSANNDIIILIYFANLSTSWRDKNI